MQKFFETITYETTRGALAPVPGGQLSVYEAGTETLATLYEDDEATPKANPLVAGDNGLVQFKVANGTYDFVFSNGVTSLEVPGIVAFDNAEPFEGKAGQEVTGSVATVVTCNAALPVDNSIPQNTEGTEVVTVTITPEQADSQIEISFQAGGSTTGSMFVSGAVFQDALANAITGSVCEEQTTGPNQKFQLGWSFKVAAGSTAARTYKLRVGPGGSGTAYVNGDSTGTRIMGGAQTATITAREVFA